MSLSINTTGHLLSTGKSSILCRYASSVHSKVHNRLSMTVEAVANDNFRELIAVTFKSLFIAEGFLAVLRLFFLGGCYEDVL